MELDLWLAQFPADAQPPEWYSRPIIIRNEIDSGNFVQNTKDGIKYHRTTSRANFETNLRAKVAWQVLILPCPPAGWDSIGRCIQDLGLPLDMSLETRDYIRSRYFSPHFAIGNMMPDSWLENDPTFEIGPCSMLTFESGKDPFAPTRKSRTTNHDVG